MTLFLPLYNSPCHANPSPPFFRTEQKRTLQLLTAKESPRWNWCPRSAMGWKSIKTGQEGVGERWDSSFSNPQRERESAVGKSEGGRHRAVKRGRKKREGSHLWLKDRPDNPASLAHHSPLKWGSNGIWGGRGGLGIINQNLWILNPG